MNEQQTCLTSSTIAIRTFLTGATRDVDDNKLDYEGFLSPLALVRYAQYLHEHRIQADGKLRDSDNWQKGIPLSVYMKSAWRHFIEWWSLYRLSCQVTSFTSKEKKALEDSLCGVIFNTMGYLHELKKQQVKDC